MSSFYKVAVIGCTGSCQNDNMTTFSSVNYENYVKLTIFHFSNQIAYLSLSPLVEAQAWYQMCENSRAEPMMFKIRRCHMASRGHNRLLIMNISEFRTAYE